MLRKFIFSMSICLCVAFAAKVAAAQEAKPAAPAQETQKQRDTRMKWWLEARYGMFIHWGVCSIKGIELSWPRGGSKPLDITGNPAGFVEDPVYDNLYKQFNPEKYDATEWVKIAKDAGMRYMVFTAKHHDGFCMWDTKLTDYKITNTPFKRDVVKELADACHEAGMPLGLYYSPRDWHHPDYGIGDNKKYRDYMNGQLRELLSNYGKVDVIWFDSYGKGDLVNFWGIGETWNLIKSLQPDAIVNNRLAILGAYNHQPAPYQGDHDTPEQSIGRMQTSRPWESCLCFVGAQWSYKPNGEMYSLQQTIRSLVSCAAGDGNMLLDVGPMPDGRIEPRQADRLKEAGDWLKKYGDSIYGTRGGPYVNGKWGGSTRRGNTIYLHVFDWKGVETLRMAPLPAKVVSAKALTGGEVRFAQTEKGLDLTLPKANRDAADTIIELTLDKPVAEIIQGESQRSMFEDPAFGENISLKASFTPTSIGLQNKEQDHAKLLGQDKLPKGFAFITADELNPKIVIDLASVKTVKGLRIENTSSGERRTANLIVSLSTDGKEWNQVWAATSSEAVWEFPVTAVVAGAQVAGRPVRYLQIETKNRKPQALLLRRVEVYGTN